MSNLFNSAETLLKLIETKGLSGIAEATLMYEEELTGRKRDEILGELSKRYVVMKESVTAVLDEGGESLRPKVFRASARRMNEAYKNSDDFFGSKVVILGNIYATAVMECNASMGRIVGAPTTGSAGIIPGCMIAAQEVYGYSDEEIINAILVTAAVGIIIAGNATLSAAKAGCQAEIGTSSSMSAAGLAYLRGLNSVQCIDASAIALQNMLGLACDPIGGFVEIPCIKRNGMGVANAFNTADVVSMGIGADLPLRDVLTAMNSIGRSMSSKIRETSRGGLAITPGARKLMKEYAERMIAERDLSKAK